MIGRSLALFIDFILIFYSVFFLDLARYVRIVWHNRERARYFWKECIAFERSFDIREIDPMAQIRSHRFFVDTVAAANPYIFNVSAQLGFAELFHCLGQRFEHQDTRWIVTRDRFIREHHIQAIWKWATVLRNADVRQTAHYHTVAFGRINSLCCHCAEILQLVSGMEQSDIEVNKCLSIDSLVSGNRLTSNAMAIFRWSRCQDSRKPQQLNWIFFGPLCWDRDYQLPADRWKTFFVYDYINCQSDIYVNVPGLTILLPTNLR